MAKQPKKRKQPEKRPYGATAVGLLALQDREFFARLLKDSGGAISEKMAEGKLRLEKTEIDRVVEVIQDRNRKLPGKDPLALWDRYKETGSWDVGDWPMGWGR